MELQNKKNPYAFPKYIRIKAPYKYDSKKYKEIYTKLACLARKLKNPNIFYKANPYKVLNHCYKYRTHVFANTKYQYDCSKYKKIYSKLINLAQKFKNPLIYYRADPDKIIKHCYIYPAYKKVYSLYAYDHDKYVAIYKKLGELAQRFKNPEIYYRVNPYRILKHCLYYNEDGTIKSLSDEKHIFRIKTLFKLYEEIAKYTDKKENIIGLKINCDEYKDEKYTHQMVRGGIKTYSGQTFSYKSAEIKHTEYKPIKERVRLHLELLRQLKKGLKMQEALENTLSKLDTNLEMKLKIEIYKKILLNYKKMQELASI